MVEVDVDEYIELLRMKHGIELDKKQREIGAWKDSTQKKQETIARLMKSAAKCTCFDHGEHPALGHNPADSESAERYKCPECGKCWRLIEIEQYGA